MERDILSRVLRNPTHAIPQAASRAIRLARPGKAVVETANSSFDVSLPIRKGDILVRDSEAAHNRVELDWWDFGRPLIHRWTSGWRWVIWEEHRLEVVKLSWCADGCGNVLHLVVADTREVAEDFLRFVVEMNERLRGEVWVFDDGYWSKSRELFKAIHKASFDDLVLAPLLDQTLLADFKSFLTAKASYVEHGIAWKRGALFEGPPGNGKTHCIKALVNELGVPCLYVKSFDCTHSSPQSSIHRVFELARQRAPCVLVLEDLDSLLAAQTRAFFLNELDGFHDNEGLITIGSTNHPERLDAAIVERPSRFDRKYYFGLPVAAERKRYVASWNARLKEDMRLDSACAEEVVARTDGFSFAYLKELYASALMAWIHEDGVFGALLAGQIDPLRAQMAPPLVKQTLT